MKKLTLLLAFLGFGFFSYSVFAKAVTFRAEKVFSADSKKTRFYVPDGLIVGGDQAINEVIVTDVRHSINPGFDRTVIDLEGSLNGEPSGIKRPPYYQVAASPEMKRIVITLWGNPKIAFNARRIHSTFSRSNAISKVELLPLVEKDRWNIVLNLKKGYPVEVFELSDPVRLILDIKTSQQ